MTSKWLCILLLAWPAVSADTVANVSSTIGWSNLAWGFDAGGRDSTEGQKMVDIDIDADPAEIKHLIDSGHIVVCYFSSGTLEPFRKDCKANETAWKAATVGKMKGWDESWLDITKLEALQELMMPRFARAKEQGCHGVEPDNIDCYDNGACWKKIEPNISKKEAKAHQLEYNRWQASAAHSLGLAIGMKNAVGIVPDMHACYDFAVNEQCQTYNECDDLQTYFSDRGKGVFQVEYTDKKNWCTGSKKFDMKTKYCHGSNSDGLCKSGNWTNCFQQQRTLPATTTVSVPPCGNGINPASAIDNDSDKLPETTVTPPPALIVGSGKLVTCPNGTGEVNMGPRDWCTINCSTTLSYNVNFGKNSFGVPNTGNVEIVSLDNYNRFLNNDPAFHYQTGSQISKNIAKYGPVKIDGPIVIVQCQNSATSCGNVKISAFVCAAAHT
jgi:hypothetical protein